MSAFRGAKAQTIRIIRTASQTVGEQIERGWAQMRGESVGARVRRSSIWSLMDFGGSQALRLASNLVLTRLLFPEAFGLMALVSLITVGLALFSDAGIRPLIVQNSRGDDRDFLNTAWTVQAIRGVMLWLLVLVIAQPVGLLYEEPQLSHVLPVAGIVLVIDGFRPTSIYSANRHLVLGRVTSIKICADTLGLIVMAILAWTLQSVWALVLGNLCLSFLNTTAYHLFLPGPKNALKIEPKALRQIFRFGIWIFLGTAAGFVVKNGDRAILGLFVPLETLGVYNIGYFLASVPILLNHAMQQRIMMPLYRIKPPTQSKSNRISLFRARRLIALSLLGIAAALSFGGPTIVDLLYDSRYSDAGAMISLFSLSVVPMVCLSTIGAALIAAGNSRAVFFIVCTTAITQTALLVVLVQNFGVAGALISPGLAALASYPVRLYYSLKAMVFDPVQDLLFVCLGFVLTFCGCVWHHERLSDVFV